MPTEVHASHILVKSEDQAILLKAKIDGGESFEDLAKQNSECPSGANGGDLGWFGRGMMVAPFEKACFTMDDGEVSEPVQTQFGWHLIKLVESR